MTSFTAMSLSKIVRLAAGMFVLTSMFAGVWQGSLAAGWQDAGVESAKPPAETASEPTGTKQETAKQAVGNDEKPIRFSFKDAEWQEVIEWFSDQAGYSLQPIQQYPEGTFTYFDGADYTVMEALDQLNYALGLRGYTLIRNRRMLILAETEQRIPNDLIETISPDELPRRGKHELLKCVFDIRDLIDSDVQRQIEDLISSNRQSDYHVIPSAGQMIVLETGQTLRTINQVLEAARQQITENSQIVKRYELKYTDPETVFTDAQLLLGLNGENQTPDGNFRVMVEPFSQTLLMRGSKQHVDAFIGLLETIDIPLAKATDTNSDAPYLRTYSVSGDLETVNKICQTMLAGRDVRFTIDTSAGKAHLRGRKTDHELLQETLEMLSSGAGDFSAIALNHISTTKAMKMLEKIYQRDTSSTSEEKPITGPIFFPDDTADRIFVRGTPQEVQDVERYLEKIDVEVEIDPSTRSTVRVLQMDTTAVSEDLFKDLFSSLGHDPGQLRVVMPRSGEKRILKERGRVAEGFDDSGPSEVNENARPDSERPAPNGLDDQSRRTRSPEFSIGRDESWKTRLADWSLADWSREATRWLAAPIGHDATWVSIPSPLQQQEPTSPSTFGSSSADQEPQDESVPGAPIELKVTDYGIVISSKDLDALDELETVIRNHFAETSEFTQGTVFYLKYRDPTEAKTILESLIGQSSSSGGGGADPLTGLIGGALNNAVPGLEGLFGGGGGGATSSAGAIFTMEQPVVIYADIPLRSLVIGATDRDMAIVEDLIVNYIDQPGAPQGPLVQGDFFRIPVLYRDPTELKTMIEQQLPDLIRQANDGNGQQAQAPEQQFIQQLLRRGQQGNQNGGGKDPELQKAVLGVDTKGSALLVSGPPYIHEQILKIVELVDTKELGQTHFQILVPNQKAELLANALKPILGEKAEIVIGGAGTGTPGTAGGGTAPGAATAGGPGGMPAMSPEQAQNAAAMRNAMMQALQQQGRGGGNRGNRGNRGGGNFGGGNRGGGGGGGNFGGRGGG